MLLNDIDPTLKKVVISIPSFEKFVNFKDLKICQQVLKHASFNFFGGFLTRSSASLLKILRLSINSLGQKSFFPSSIL